MSDKHQFFQNIVTPLTSVYEQAEAEEITYRLIDAYLGKTRLSFWDILTEIPELKSKSIIKKFDHAIERLLKYEPVQYVVGSTYFLDYLIKVTPDTLIPRQETEELVAHIINLEKGKRELVAMDIGTGSGCIPIAIAKSLQCHQVIAVDVSDKALSVARENAHINLVDIDFLKLDILNEDIPYQNLDIVVSNPPYVLESDKLVMDKNVLDYEPELALFVPDDDPLRFYKSIASKALKALKEGGKLYLEIHEKYGKELTSMLQKLGYREIEIIKDVFLSKERMIFCKK